MYVVSWESWKVLTLFSAVWDEPEWALTEPVPVVLGRAKTSSRLRSERNPVPFGITPPLRSDGVTGHGNKVLTYTTILT
ncbi:hypothetical protein K449DRAFT_387666, partial [Hypoxylon sp. EC38]